MLNGKIVSIIFASPVYAQEGKLVIGKNGDMPWRNKVPSDMKRFVELTKYYSVVMGRKTWDSIPEKYRPFDRNLPPGLSRQSIIITRNKGFAVDNSRVIVAHSLEEAVQLAKSVTVWIIGGAEIYALALPHADYMHWTMIQDKFDGDTFFPNYNRNNWRNTHFQYFKAGKTGAEKDKIDSSYLILQRI